MASKDEIAEQLYDELQHNRIINCEEYDKRLKELGGEASEEIDNIIHNKCSFGFCDMCGEVIFYDEGGWYDLCGDLYDYERERIEQRLPADTDIQDVCSVCFAKLVADEDD